MTPQETHNYINLGLQKMGSFAYDNIKSEFIDAAFNRMGDAYISDKTTRRNDPKQAGFEDNITRLSSIRELVTEAHLIAFNDVTAQFSILPANYFSFVEAQASLTYSCTNSAITFSISPVSEYIATLSFTKADFGVPSSTPFSATKIYKVINTVPIEIFDFSDFSTGLNDLDEIFTVINKALDEINRQSNLKVYWESYKGIYYPDQFIFVSNDDAFLNQGVKVEYTAVLNSSSAFTSTPYTKFNEATSNNTSTKNSFCRLVSNEEIYHLLNHPFGKTNLESPLMTIFNDTIEIFRDKRFILNELILKYIRKPRRMNLNLNQSYEIQDTRAIHKIIDMTVEYLSATIESQGYQALALENQQRD
jgi:hypothetical protein